MYFKVKRLLDYIISLTTLVLLLPLILIIIFLIKIDSNGPILFKQKRVGLNKTYFEILKFRTMRVDTPKDVPTHLLENPEQYITRVGRILRKTSLDELPQIFNVISGSMSIVGPRPALWNQYDLIEKREECCANQVLPGLTGWAQINGRDTISTEDKARFDGEYIKNFGFIMDLKCFIGTIKCVIKRTGIVEGAIKFNESEIINIEAKDIIESKDEEKNKKITNNLFL